jgi:hypothetical protein
MADYCGVECSWGSLWDMHWGPFGGTEPLLVWELKRELGKLRADLGLWKNS